MLQFMWYLLCLQKTKAFSHTSHRAEFTGRINTFNRDVIVVNQTARKMFERVDNVVRYRIVIRILLVVDRHIIEFEMD